MPYFTLLLRYLTLYYFTLSYLTLPYLTLPYLTLPYLTAFKLPYFVLYHITLRYIALHCIKLHYIALHVHCIILHYITVSQYMFSFSGIFSGSLTIWPSSGNMLGGENIFLAGPCYNKTADQLVCKFNNQLLVAGTVVSGIRARCIVPMLNVTGRIPLQLSVNGGHSFDFKGVFTSGMCGCGETSGRF